MLHLSMMNGDFCVCVAVVGSGYLKCKFIEKISNRTGNAVARQGRSWSYAFD